MAALSATIGDLGEPIESPWLEHAFVSGFQGSRKFEINFSRSANFLIGKNGCGKTTLINLINAGLSGDAQSLFRIRFSELRLRLTFGYDNSRYTLSYKRIGREDHPIRQIDFSILGPRGGVIYKQNVYDRERFGFRSAKDHVFYDNPSSFDIDFAFAKASRTKPITTWLSILRSDPSRAPNPEAVLQNPIDRKLEELSKRISSYLSALDSRSSNRSANFQKDYFLSLIGYSGGDAFGQAVSQFQALDLNAEEATLGKILSHLKLGLIDYKHKLQSHFDNARLTRNKGTYTVQDALQISDTLRIHELNEKWLAFEQDRAGIYAPKQAFIDIVNELFVTKILAFTDRNQPTFQIPGDRKLNLSDLSSGEKQVYIILAEALVQEGKRAIYLADEPELSLHVQWQQYLVENIFVLNGQCQVIFATHSPDILGAYSDNAIDVERL